MAVHGKQNCHGCARKFFLETKPAHQSTIRITTLSKILTHHAIFLAASESPPTVGGFGLGNSDPLKQRFSNRPMWWTLLLWTPPATDVKTWTIGKGRPRHESSWRRRPVVVQVLDQIILHQCKSKAIFLSSGEILYRAVVVRVVVHGSYILLDQPRVIPALSRTGWNLSKASFRRLSREYSGKSPKVSRVPL